MTAPIQARTQSVIASDAILQSTGAFRAREWLQVRDALGVDPADWGQLPAVVRAAIIDAASVDNLAGLNTLANNVQAGSGTYPTDAAAIAGIQSDVIVDRTALNTASADMTGAAPAADLDGATAAVTAAVGTCSASVDTLSNSLCAAVPVGSLNSRIGAQSIVSQAARGLLQTANSGLVGANGGSNVQDCASSADANATTLLAQAAALVSACGGAGGGNVSLRITDSTAVVTGVRTANNNAAASLNGAAAAGSLSSASSNVTAGVAAVVSPILLALDDVTPGAAGGSMLANMNAVVVQTTQLETGGALRTYLAGEAAYAAAFAAMFPGVNLQTQATVVQIVTCLLTLNVT